MNFESRLRAIAKKHHVLGYSIQLIKHGELNDYFAFGIVGKNAAARIQSQTLFQAASLSKTVAAIVALRLVEEDRIKLSEVKRILSHMAGYSVKGFDGYEIEELSPTLDDIVKGTFPANSEPIIRRYKIGRYRYSGGGYVMLQKMIEERTKMKFETLAKKYVFKPLGLKRSTYSLLYPNKEKNAAFGRAPKSKLKGEWKLHPESTAAGLWTTPAEMAQIVSELMKAQKGRSTLFSRHLAEAMMHSESKNVGLGTFTHTTKRGIAFSHDGANAGYRSRYLALPDGNGVVIMTNSDHGFPFIDEIVPFIGKEYHWGKCKLKF